MIAMGWKCEHCGFQVHGGVGEAFVARHTCHPDGIARTQARRLEGQFGEWLDTPDGRFSVFYARRLLDQEDRAA